MSPVGVSPSTELAAQAGAMLIDNPSARFNSPCHRFQSDPGRDPHDSVPFRPLSRQHSSSEAHHSTAPATEPWQLRTAPMTLPPQQLQLQNAAAQDGFSRDNEDQDEWCAGVANILPEMSDDLLRLRKSPADFTTQPASLSHSSAHAMGSMPMLPVGSAAYLPVAGFGWDTSRLEPVLNTRAAPSQASHIAPSCEFMPTALLPTLGMQHQQTQLAPTHSTGQLPGSGARAMEQLALSTAATVDLLAGMAASSSQAHPRSASDLILAASATLQAFARSAQSSQVPCAGHQAPLPNGATVISQVGQGLSHLPAGQRQHVAFMQQQFQLQQQQCLGWYQTNGA